MDSEAKLKQLEEDINLAYDSLDERISRLEAEHSENIAVFGVAASIVIGVVQIIIALMK